MKYVFDSDSLIDLFWHYYPERFPTLWEKFDTLVAQIKRGQGKNITINL